MGELAAGQPRRTPGNLRLATVGAYTLVVLVCFLAGYMLVPLPEGERRSGVSLERVRLPEPQPIEEFALWEIDAAGVYDRDRLLGRWTLMYFGYSHCPDVCGPTLALLTGLGRDLRALPDWSRPLEIVFVTVDPARDTPDVLRDYLPSDVVGLTGSERQIAELSSQVGIMHFPGERDAAGNYLVDHPATILVIDPAARLRAGFRFPHDSRVILEQLVDIAREFDTDQAR